MDAYQAMWLVFIIVWMLAAIASKRTVRRQTLSSRILQGVIVILGFLLLLQPWRFQALDIRFVPAAPATTVCGLTLTAAGIGIAFWARFALGRNWSGTVTVKQDHQLIRNGPYRIVRHPIYSGFLLAMAGTAIGYGMMTCLLGLALTFVGLWTKWKTEEKFMVEQFGAQYLQYRREVKAVIPGVL